MAFLVLHNEKYNTKYESRMRAQATECGGARKASRTVELECDIQHETHTRVLHAPAACMQRSPSADRSYRFFLQDAPVKPRFLIFRPRI